MMQPSWLRVFSCHWSKYQREKPTHAGDLSTVYPSNFVCGS